MASRPRPGIMGTTTTIDLKTAYVARDERFGNGDTSKTSQMRLMTSQSMPGVVGMALTVALETAEAPTVREWKHLNDGELDGDEGTDNDGGEYDIGDDEIDEDNSLGTSGSVSNNSISNGSDSNGSDPNKLESSEWCDDRDDILELKELGERGYGVLKEPVDIIRDSDTRTLGRWPFRSCPFGRSLFSGCQKDGSVETSSKMGSSKRVRLSKVSDPKEMEDAVETKDGVLVNATWDRCGVSMGVETVVEYGARREGEGTVGDSVTWMVLPMQRLTEAETDIDTIGVREGEDVTTSLVPEKRMQKPINDSYISSVSGAQRDPRIKTEGLEGLQDGTMKCGMFLALLTLEETVGTAPKSKGELTVETSSDQYLGLLRSGLRDNFNDPLGRLRGSDLDGLFYEQVGSNWDWLFDRPGDSLNFLVNRPYDDCTVSENLLVSSVLSKMVLKGEEREWSEERSGGRWRDRYRCCDDAVPRNADTDIDTICVRRFCPREKRERIVDERPSRERERLTLPLPVGRLCPPIVSNIIHRFAVSIGIVGVVEIGHIQ
ncbi:hypothetical protein EDB86DRAFT_2832954 [Lactarius hatsudake]|nr:hypothetical protein EDB86DRAFT_2832954 [Lactarius hatsudake]